ncbi:helix-turn-helix domain-containing protein [Streptomyces sp. RKAG337]|uniref:helix-turn-helix domain-containing protein n=1 Tax=Streptomyces sp. RKAG337 TaxID=2893404 RepID=UPI0020333EF8|nr:helix-turn-helix transcriptional regulator [Streptomyces sp. RKAG337]MCM2427400.1 helix-turn-helix domain-containing protein [Streptomyces sp. RKAG337]
MPGWVLPRRQAIGQRIRSTREHAHLTQEALAGATGLDRSTIIRIEAGSSSTFLDHLLLIAGALGVPLADLVRE